MKINALGLPVITNNATRRISSGVSVSFGNNNTVNTDEFLSEGAKNIDNLKIILKNIKQKNDIKNATNIFLDVLNARKKDIDAINKQKEMDSLIEQIQCSSELQDIVLQSRNMSEKEKSFILTITKSNIEKNGSKIEKMYNDGLEPANYKRLKLLKTIAKHIVKMPSFNPNYENESGKRLINIALDAKDKEMAKLVMNHPEFDEMGSFTNDFEKARFEALKKKSFVQLFRNWVL